GDLVAGRVEALHEVDGLLVPAGGEPEEAPVAAVAVDGLELLLAELHAPAGLDVGEAAPPRGPPPVPPVAGARPAGGCASGTPPLPPPPGTRRPRAGALPPGSRCG